MLATAEEFPELTGTAPISDEHKPADIQAKENHAAAMELAPSKKAKEMDFDAWAEAEIETKEQDFHDDSELKSDEGDMQRIRILQSVDEPIITIDGEITLGAGDVLFLDEMTANYLIESGIAEIATL